MVRRSVVVALATVFILLGSSVEAEAKGRGPKRNNLPRGWKWPPARETKREGRKCMRELRKLGVRFKRAPRRRMIATPVVVPDMKFGPLTLTPTYRKPPFVMDCRLARSFALNAERLSALGIAELRFSSIYDYRRVRLRRKVHPALSRHALGLAVDVFQIVLVGGQVIDVEDDYWASPVLMVAELALRSTGGFRAILSPAVDPTSHDDHLHIEVAVEHPELDTPKKKKQRRKRRARRLSSLRE
ncbi:MAG TPA: extensin family protein [Kofleriaceae bacterium]|nr:extensin family protein [Kofleriaceae bacterium]